MVDRGLEALEARDGPDSEPPDEVVNVCVSTGRLQRARELIARALRDRTTFVPEPESGTFLPFVADLALHEIRLLGGLGLEGLIDERFAEIEGAWDRRTYSDEQRRPLRAAVAHLVAPALVHSPVYRTIWLSEDEDRSPYWEPWFAEGPEQTEALDRAIALHQRERPPSQWTYVLGMAALAQGRHEDAARLMSSVRGRPLSVSFASGGWGMRVIAALVEARALEAMGDPDATEPYRYVAVAWAEADELARTIVEEATEGLARSRPGDRGPGRHSRPLFRGDGL